VYALSQEEPLMNFDWHQIWRHLWHTLQPFEYLFTFAIGGSAVAVRRYWQKIREGRAAGWPSADAVIQSATVRSHEGYDVQVSYRYYVAQEYRYGKYQRHFRKKEPAEAFAETLRGRSLPVRYREDNPNVSVLMERDLEMLGIMQATRQLG
jgi:hypothetical protein